MKSINKFALLFAAAVGTLTSCSNEDVLLNGSENDGKTVHMVVTALRDGTQEMGSRTDLEEDGNGNLAFTWTVNDQILVTDANGLKKGFLKLKSGAGTNNGTFEGDLRGVNNGTVKLNYYYLGLNHGNVADGEEAYTEVISKEPYTADYSVQEGSLQSLSYLDMLSDFKQTVIAGDYSYSDFIDLKRRISFARFLMEMPVEAKMPYKAVTLSGSELGNKATIQLTDGDAPLEKMTYDKGNVVLNNLSTNDFYITYLPTKNEFDITFMVEDANGKFFQGTFTINKEIGQSKYLRRKNDLGQYQGIPVTFTPVVDYKIILKEDPEGTKDYDTIENPEDPTRVPLPGNPITDPTQNDAHREFLGWKTKDGSEPTLGPWNLTTDGPTVTLYPVYSANYIWTIEWRSGYGDNELVPEQGEEKYIGTKDKLTAGYDGIKDGKEYPLPEGYPNDKNNKRRRRTPIGLGKNNPTREGFVFDGWLLERPGNVNGDSEVDANYTWGPNNTILYTTGNIAENTKWTIVYKAKWKRVYEIVYHFNSADPKHSNTGGEENAGYNAKVTDRPEGVENGYNYYVISSTSDRFKNQGGVAQTDANGGKFIGWKKCTECTDHYMNDNGIIDSEIKDRVFTEGDTWTFKDGKYILHLEPVYEAAPKTVSTPGYRQGTFN